MKYIVFLGGWLAVMGMSAAAAAVISLSGIT